MKEHKYNNLLKVFLIPATGAVFTGVLYAIHFWFYGKFPEMSRLFTMIFWFGKAGLLQLPMPWCGLWLIPAGIYFAALSRLIGRITKKQISDREKMLFFITITGCGLLGYYIGRSHISNLFSASYPAIILAAAAAERLRGKAWYVMRFASVFLLFFISLHGINACRKLTSVSPDQRVFQIYFNRLCDNVKKRLPNSKKMLYSGQLEAMIAVEIGAKAPFSHPALEEIFWKKDCLDYIKNTRKGQFPALWIINMNWVNRHAPAFMRDLITEQVRKRLNAPVPSNAMLMFYL